MLLNLAARRRLLLLGGKGGVGKTTLAGAVSLAQARQGRRTLVVSTDPAHSLGHLFDVPLGDRPAALAPGLDGLEIDPDATVARHLEDAGTMLRSMMPAHLAGAVDAHLELARSSPGTHEAAVLDRLAAVVTGALEGGHGTPAYDLVVVDTAPSGHTARLLSLPESMTLWMDALLQRRDRSERFGELVSALGPSAAASGRAARDAQIREVITRRRDRLSGLHRILTDPRSCSFAIVLNAERLAVLETGELHAQLSAEGVDVGALVVNRRSPADQGPQLAARREREEVHLAALRTALPQVPLLEVPHLERDVLGTEGLEALAAHGL
ncbi:ArsA family ATPase [Brachybacterium phenoliresistens]|uniref:Arsenic ABC transporter ATPase n=1 Tax=Brachybacterium phenoliresistens TaxID=396014 RepID=Z9JNW7_9MICO|nr:ArsA family ATPase [Brachybacterium phenoliresistens]EWS79703.1 arsenic ABC transporter ATPase [Brachybacterium phenoliresistens]